MTYVARTKDQRQKLRDVPEQTAGKPVLLSCGCRLMREPDVTAGRVHRYWCHGAWRTVKR